MRPACAGTARLMASTEPDTIQVRRAALLGLRLRLPVHDPPTEVPSQLTPAALVRECEIVELWGIRGVGGRPLNRRLLSPAAEPARNREVPRSGAEVSSDQTVVMAARVVPDEAFEFPVDPVPGVGQESLRMGLGSTGEARLEPLLGLAPRARGIEYRLNWSESGPSPLPGVGDDRKRAGTNSGGGCGNGHPGPKLRREI
jgi:hypothetical protein